jgi:hypothetical protein
MSPNVVLRSNVASSKLQQPLRVLIRKQIHLPILQHPTLSQLLHKLLPITHTTKRIVH